MSKDLLTTLEKLRPTDSLSASSGPRTSRLPLASESSLTKTTLEHPEFHAAE